MMNSKSTRRVIFLCFVMTVIISCDQASKVFVRDRIDYNENIDIVKDHFILTKIENSGAFLSLGDELPQIFKFIVLLGLPLLALAYGLYYLLTKYNLPAFSQIAICCIIGGGVGNLYDRMLYGSVTDFMHIDFYLFRTGVFNFADVFIMIGIGILLVQSVKSQMTSHKAL